MTSALRPMVAACPLTLSRTDACKTGRPMFKPESEQTALWR